jgi:RNA recognition motif-containing protein
MQSHVSQVEDATVMIDHGTERSRGFGFITFASAGSVEGAMAEASHELDGKTVEVGPARKKTGDWQCSECPARVFASKNACFLCGAKKPGGGGGAGGFGYNE